MGDHTHGQGEVMLSYRYMFMNMDGNRDGTKTLTNDEVLQDYMVTPTKMPMQMHMLGAMYAVSDQLTLMAMASYIQSEMDHLTRMGGEFTTESSGIGDVSLTGLITLGEFGNQRMHAHLGVRIPTGSIEQMDVTPASSPDETILPYPMQIGSGTFDLLPGITYLGQKGNLSWGNQIKGTIRLGENDNGYTLGNRVLLNGWLGFRASDWFAPMLRLELNSWGKIDGADDRLNPNMIHTADPDLKSGTRIDIGLGTNFLIPAGSLEDLRFAAELTLPFYQNLDGPQMETDWILTFGLQYSL
ncbi:MAG: hypothetical protein WD355_07985 [Balneolaceae bacterium]